MWQVQSGVGRTGKWWAHEHFKGVVPDIMLFAKGIASGFPFAGIAAKPEMYQGLLTGSLVTYSPAVHDSSVTTGFVVSA